MPLVAQFRSSLENPQTPLSYPAEWLLDIFNGGRTDSGLRVSEMTALQVTTVFACVQLISSAIGFLPFHVYEMVLAKDKRPAKRLAFEHDLYDLIRYEPNPEMTSFTFRKTLQAHALLWGNLYAEIQRDGGNRPVAVWPRNPARCRPYRVGRPTRLSSGEVAQAGELVYKTTEGTEDLQLNPEDGSYRPAGERMIAAADMIHIPGLALDGRVGQSAIQLARQAVGLSLATEKFGAKFFGNGAHVGGVLTHPGKLTPEAREQARRSWQEAQGGENHLRTALLEQGITFNPTSIKPDEAQFLETRKLQVSETCRIFGVPPHMVGETEKSNRANTEQIGLEFVTFSLNPWLEAWQQEGKRKFFPRPSGAGRPAKKFILKFETRPLTMPDAESLGKFLTIVKQWGYGSTNDGREWLDWNPIDEPWADQCWIPVNMTAVGDEPDPTEEDEDGDPAQKVAQRFGRMYAKLFRDGFRRVLARSDADDQAFQRIFFPILDSISTSIAETCHAGEDLNAEGFLREHIVRMRTRLGEWRSANGDAEKVVDRELRTSVVAIWQEINRATRAKNGLPPEEVNV